MGRRRRNQAQQKSNKKNKLKPKKKRKKENWVFGFGLKKNKVGLLLHVKNGGELAIRVVAVAQLELTIGLSQCYIKIANRLHTMS